MESSFLVAVGIIAIVMISAAGMYLVSLGHKPLKGSFMLLSGFSLASVSNLLRQLDADKSIVVPVVFLVITGIGFIIAFMVLGARISKYRQDKKAKKASAS